VPSADHQGKRAHNCALFRPIIYSEELSLGLRLAIEFIPWYRDFIPLYMSSTSSKKLVVIGLLGTTLDQGKGPKRWEHWRPTVALCQHENLLVDRLELIHPPKFTALAQVIGGDLARVSPETRVQLHDIELDDPWALELVYEALYDFARGYDFRPEQEDYLVHITTGTHVAQICMFLLTESQYFPARLIQTSPPTRDTRGGPGTFTIIDLDLSKYDRIASRFQKEQREGLSFLKSGIDTKNVAFNQLIERIEQVGIRSKDPILLMGPTGSGKSQLARRIYELKKTRRQVQGEFVEVNCATLRGDSAMSALFGHVKGAFTGAAADRPGLLRKAHAGLLFLDELGELGPDEQAMLLRAIEEKSFYPVGSDREARSDFQLIAGTNHDLAADVGAGTFREDLLARINVWSFRLPGLGERPEDIEPNLEYELEQCARASNLRLTFTRQARAQFLSFAASADARWTNNFRDFNAAIRRMATLCSGGRIGTEEVTEEIARLRESWRRTPLGSAAVGSAISGTGALAEQLLGQAKTAEIDEFDRVQLEEVLRVCLAAPTLSEAGRRLFNVSRTRKTTANDADRLRKYLARFSLEWSDLHR
jgi:transcriptional regulatory protein RtcR